MFDHISIGVRALARSMAFYDAALAPLGVVRLWDNARAAGYGPAGFAGEAPFAIIQMGDGVTLTGAGVHLALRAADRAAVDGFYTGALACGGQCDGPPGVREHYNPGYYAAFVRDPDGHRLEAVVHEPVAPS